MLNSTSLQIKFSNVVIFFKYSNMYMGIVIRIQSKCIHFNITSYALVMYNFRMLLTITIITNPLLFKL